MLSLSAASTQHVLKNLKPYCPILISRSFSKMWRMGKRNEFRDLSRGLIQSNLFKETFRSAKYICSSSFERFRKRNSCSVLGLVRKVLQIGVSQTQIGIISPYRQQVKEIYKLLALGGLKFIKVGTTEEFQGCEFDVILVSTVRTNESLLNFDVRTGLGFVSNRKRTCVTLTR